MSSFPNLDGQIEFGPTFVYEYSTRETYGQDVEGWGPDDPLNATWWHLVTEREFHIFLSAKDSSLCEAIKEMEKNSSLVQTFHTFQGKSSVVTGNCSDECVAAKICYIRSGSAPIGQNCPQGFGSVQ